MGGGVELALLGLGVVLLAMTLVWVVSLHLEDASVADPFWGPGFALVTTIYLLADGRMEPRGILVFLLVTAWALRLGWHLGERNRRLGEDHRYVAMRREHGDRFGVISLFTVFWLQGALLWVISAPLFGAVRSTAPLGVWDLLGSAVFLLGFSVEVVADAQLARFRADPANHGRVLDQGLWRYSRHPNYFGEAVLWWGLYLVAVGGGAWWSAVGPLLITYLLLRVSGVTMLERSLRVTRPGYADYIRRTSVFVPWPPKETRSTWSSG